MNENNVLHLSDKRRRGRPSKFKNRTITITARIDISERDKLQALCDHYEKTPSDILRDLINNKFNEIYK